MKSKFYTFFILLAFISVSVFGLYLFTTHMGHEMDCPFSIGETALCAAPLEHLQHWQSAFTAVLVEVLVFGVLILAFFTQPDVFREGGHQYVRSRSLHRSPLRPTLFQELFAQGILNRKAP